MSNYRQAATQTTMVTDRATKMRQLLEDRIRRGREGIDLNEDKKGYSPFIIHRNHEMNDGVFDVGVKLMNENPLFSYRAWVHWMTDAEIHRGIDMVTISHRSQFFCAGAAEHFRDVLAEHFGVPVQFRSDISIKNRVEV